jgi:hypothetical protein
MLLIRSFVRSFVHALLLLLTAVAIVFPLFGFLSDHTVESRCINNIRSCLTDAANILSIMWHEVSVNDPIICKENNKALVM